MLLGTKSKIVIVKMNEGSVPRDLFGGMSVDAVSAL